MENSFDGFAQFLTPAFLLACVAAAALAEFAKRIVRWRWSNWYASKSGQSFLQVLNIVAGPPAFWLASPTNVGWKMSLAFGLAAGLLSHYVYSLVRRWIGDKKPGGKDTAEVPVIGEGGGEPPKAA
jgi:hypothetical protein